MDVDVDVVVGFPVVYGDRGLGERTERVEAIVVGGNGCV